MILVLIGPPGSGKGTQAARVALALDVPRISTGDILRRAIEAGDALGASVGDAMSRGELVGNEIMIGLVSHRLAHPDAARGFVLDGFPRTIEQAVALDALLEERGPLAAIELTVPDSELRRRLSQRRVCGRCGASARFSEDSPESTCACGGSLVLRPDDDDQVVRDRLAVYAKATAPVLEFYRGRRALHTINGNLPTDQVTERINLAIDPIFEKYFSGLPDTWSGGTPFLTS